MAVRNYLISGCTRLGVTQDKNLNRYIYPLGILVLDPTLGGLVEETLRDSFTITNYFVRIYTNGITANTVFTLLINRGNGDNTVTVPSEATGTFQDTVHSDSVVATDEICHKKATPDSGTSITTSVISFQMQHASADVPILGSSGSHSAAPGSTYYIPLLGAGGIPSTTEAWAAYKVRDNRGSN